MIDIFLGGVGFHLPEVLAMDPKIFARFLKVFINPLSIS